MLKYMNKRILIYGYEPGIFRLFVLHFGNKDVRDVIIRLVQPLTDDFANKLYELGYKERISCFDFHKNIHGFGIYAKSDDSIDIFNKRKEGKKRYPFS